MNYITNYYKNLSEQLQEKVNVLQYKVKQLNEMAAPPWGGFGNVDDIMREIERIVQGLAKQGRQRVPLDNFLDKFHNLAQRLAALGRAHNYPLEFLRMLVHGEDFISFEGRLFNISKDGKYLLEQLPNGDIVIVKNIKDSPWGAWEGGHSTVYQQTGTVFRPLPNGGWGQWTPAVAPFFLDRDDDTVPGDFRVDQEPPDSATPTSPQSPAGTPVRHWSQDWHP